MNSLYMQEIKDEDYDVLTKEEEQRLGYRVLDGDSNARNELVAHNLRYVIKIVSKYNFSENFKEDLIQAGNEGLLYAASHYDVRSGNRFLTYATNWIRFYIQEYINVNSKPYRLPKLMYQDINKYKKVCDEFNYKYCRMPSTLELMKIMHKSKKTMDNIIFHYEKTKDVDDLENVSIPANEEEIFEHIEQKEMSKVLSNLFKKVCLKDNEIMILRMLYGLDGYVYSEDEVAEHLHISRQWVNHCKGGALRKIRLSKFYDDLLIYSESPIKAQETQKLELKKFIDKRTKWPK